MTRETFDHLVGTPRPKIEDETDLYCWDCAEQWCSDKTHPESQLPYTRYVGSKNCVEINGELVKICPNGCTNWLDEPGVLVCVFDHHILTDSARWEIAHLFHEKCILEDKIDSITVSLKAHGV